MLLLLSELALLQKLCCTLEALLLYELPGMFVCQVIDCAGQSDESACACAVRTLIVPDKRAAWGVLNLQLRHQPSFACWLGDKDSSRRLFRFISVAL